MKKIIGIVDGAFGDSGKGRTVQCFAHKLISKGVDPKNIGGVKTNGTGNCAHHVFVGDGDYFCYSQLSSASHLGVPTVIGRNFVVVPYTLYEERQGFYDKFGFYPVIYIHGDCMITSEYLRRIAKSRTDTLYNTTRSGLKEAKSCNPVYVKDFIYGSIPHHLFDHRDKYINEVDREELNVWPISEEYAAIERFLELENVYIWFDELDLPEFSYYICESGQGLFLDEDCVEESYDTLTWTKTNGQEISNFSDNIKIPHNEIEWVCVIRPYITRHGAGPLENEESFDMSRHCVTPELNEFNEEQGPFRYTEWNHYYIERLKKELYSANWKLFVTHMDSCDRSDLQIFNNFRNMAPIGCSFGVLPEEYVFFYE